LERRPFIYGIAVFLLLLGLTQVPTYQQYHIEREKEHQALLRELTNVKARFLALLYNDIAAANTLAVIAKEYDLSHHFDSVARQVLEKSKYGVAIQLTWDGVIRNVYPLAGYENTIGINTHRDSLRLSEETMALQKGDVFFAGPRNLRQGGVGILGKVPVLVGGKLKGIVVILTKMDAIRAALDPDGNNSEFAYQLSKKTGIDTVVYSLSAQKPAKKAETVAAQIPQGDWILTVCYSELHHFAGFPFVFSVLGALLAFSAAYLTFRKTREPYLLNKIIKLKTRSLSESEQKFRRLVERSLVGVYIAQEDKFVYVNPKFEEIMDSAPGQLIGQHIYSIIHPDDVAIATEKVRLREQNQDEAVRYEIRCMTQKKRLIWIEIFGTKTFYNGKPALIGTVLDATARKNSVEEIERKASELKAFFNNVEGAASLLDENKKYVIFNDRFIYDHTLLTGEPPRKGMEVYDLFPPEIKRQRLELIDKVIREGKKESLEASYTRDGKNVYYRSSFNPIIVNGKVTGVATYSLDLTQIKEAEQAVREAEVKFRSLVEQSPVGVYIFKNGRFVYVNPRMAEASGYPEDALMSLPLEQLVYPEDLPLVHHKIAQRMTGAVDEDRYEIRTINSAGEMQWVELFGTVIEYEGEPAIIGTVVDITDRKKMIGDIMKSEANLRAIFDTTQVWYLFLDTEFRVLALNRGFEEGYYWQTGIRIKKGDYFPDCLYAGRRPQVIEVLNRALQQETVEYEVEYTNKQENRHYFSTVSPVVSDDSVLGICFITHDITTRKNLALEREKIITDLIQRNKDLEQFAYIISHNLRAPVANILGISALLQDDALSAEEHNGLSCGMHASVQRLDEVVNDLNTILQVRREISEIKETIRFANIVASIQESIGQLMEQNEVTIQCNFDAAETVYNIKTYIYSIFYNLITNSIKYRKQTEPCRISIESRKEDKILVLLFKDNGTGIDLKKQGDKMFGLYKRFHSHIEGKGMGLYMVKTQIETLGGRISVSSEPGIGTEFKIELKT